MLQMLTERPISEILDEVVTPCRCRDALLRLIEVLVHVYSPKLDRLHPSHGPMPPLSRLDHLVANQVDVGLGHWDFGWQLRRPQSFQMHEICDLLRLGLGRGIVAIEDLA